MKKLFLFWLLGFFLSATVYAQKIPQGMKYQAVARNLSGEILVNQKISLKISLGGISSGSKSLVNYYSEAHDVITDQLGLFTLVIGEGKVQTGTFDKIPWSTEDIWMQVAIKDKGKTDFTTISNSKLLAVPYAFHAGSANSLSNNSNNKISSQTVSNAGVPAQSWSLFGNSNTGPGDKLGTTDFADLIMVTNNIERLKIEANGNVDIARSLKIGADLTVDSSAFLNKIGGSTFNYGAFTVDRISPTYLTGTLMVDKSTNLNDSFNVNNESPTALTGTLTVDKRTDLKNTLNVTGTTNLNDSLHVNGVSNLNGQVTISATLPPAEGVIDNYPLIVQGSRNGISVKIQGATPNRNENFITFWDGNGNARGRIEGFTNITEPNRSEFIDLVNNSDTTSGGTSQDPNQPLPDVPTPLQNVNNNYAFGALTQTLSVVRDIVKFVINLIACVAGVGVFGDCDDVAWSAIDAVVSGVQLGAYIAYNQGNPGVAYESGGADYAEWLPKSDKEEVMGFGDVVGVKAGVISRTFADADKFMVVSRNPGVIGGLPGEGEELVYEKIAFMGQVPVKVIGEVHKEDYILPSGNGDGMAIAVSPDSMKTRDFKRIIGIAWSESDPDKEFNYINTAVGINANDMAETIEDMQVILNNVQMALKKVVPGYNPSLYNVDKKVTKFATDYTKTQSLKEIAGNNINMSQYSNATDALKGIKQYALAQGMNLSEYPYLTELFDNPTPELAQKALEHYQKVLAKVEHLIANAEKKRNASGK